MTEQPAQDSTLEPPKKKLYVKPCLIEYGSVEKLTHTGTSIFGDAGPMMMPGCL
ncbi:MAG TPA: hypothetical protein VKG20_08665 [Methylomirabilota bacterium]|nr:hypothetical protein [Methylomirabilota bacterium]